MYAMHEARWLSGLSGWFEPTFVTSTTFVTAHHFCQFISTVFVNLTTFVNFCQLRAHQFCQQYLTRFNKIAIQGTPRTAVDKEAIVCLSRVYSYYSKCNFPLCYVYPALTRYLSILFLNILTLLACTHSSDNVFHTLMETS